MPVHALCIPAKDAETLRAKLASVELLDNAFHPKREKGTVCFALKEKPDESVLEKLRVLSPGISLVEAELEPRESLPPSLSKALEGALSAPEREALVTSFDVIGSIAVIDIPETLAAKQDEIARALIESHPGVRTVCRRAGETQGEFRVRPVQVIAGDTALLTEHREHGCRFKVEVGAVFFSPRLSFERGRIAKLISSGETVGALFAGVGPYPIVFAKNSPMKRALAVELNPRAVELMKENISLNHVAEKIEVFEGDARTLVPAHLKGKCDRVTMPLPHGAGDFLAEGFACLKPGGGTLHFYHVAKRKDPFGEARGLVEKEAARAGFLAKVVFEREVRSFTPATVQVVLDAHAKPKDT